MHGSGSLVRWLFDNQLVDEIILLTYPVVVGQGTRLFPDTGPDTALELVESRSTSGWGDDPGLPALRAPAVRAGDHRLIRALRPRPTRLPGAARSAGRW